MYEVKENETKGEIFYTSSTVSNSQSLFNITRNAVSVKKKNYGLLAEQPVC